jgi:hypothetical protein
LLSGIEREQFATSIDPLQTEATPGLLAGVISRQASSANLGSHGVHRARRRYADVPYQGGAAIAVAPHAPLPVIDQLARNSIKVGVVLRRKPGPLR